MLNYSVAELRVYRNKKGKTKDDLAQSIFITLYQYYKILPVRENFKTG